MWWHNFYKQQWFENDWNYISISFNNLMEANNYIKKHIQKEEEEFQKYLDKMKKLDMKPKFHKIV